MTHKLTSDELAQWRRALGFTQAEMARRFAVSRQAYNFWERNKLARGLPFWVVDQMRWINDETAPCPLPKRRAPVKGERRGPYQINRLAKLDNAPR